MKYIKATILLLSAVLAFSACTAVVTPPAVPTDFTSEAQVTFGEFTYRCTVQRTANAVTVTVSDTAAAGLTIACDGDTVTFTYNDMTKSFAKNKIDVTNPACVLWEVFDSVVSGRCETARQDTLTVYSGACSAGAFSLTQNADGSLAALTLSAASIRITFEPNANH